MNSVAQHCHDMGYPTFTPAFEPAKGVEVPLYLTLLNLSTRNETQIAIQAVRRAVAGSPKPTVEVVALFDDYNWRPHLVGAVAMLTGLVNDDTLRALWEAVDGGSWVSPQLAATAFVCDPAFEQETRLRIEAGCPTNVYKMKRLAELDWATRHSAAGPSSSAMYSSKTLASLVALCRTLTDAALWVERALENESITKLLEDDYDHADRITIEWLDAVKALLPEIRIKIEGDV